jgi:flagella basal body P-ring formation protein FlgA
MNLQNFLNTGSRVLLLVLLGLSFHPKEALSQSALLTREKGEVAGQPLDRSEVARYLEDQMQKALGDERKTVRVKDLQGGERVTVPSANFSWEAKFPDRFFQGGTIPVSLILKAGGEKAQEIRVQARVEVFAEVVMTRNSLRRHQMVEERDVQVVNKNIASFPGDVATDLQEVVGKRMTLSLNPQEVLRKSMVEVPPLVKKGDRVTLLVENASFKITSMGEAKEEGRSGERIKVVNISSQKEVYGRVVDAHTVQVDY